MKTEQTLDVLYPAADRGGCGGGDSKLDYTDTYKHTDKVFVLG
jgi:hypothetical protein